MGFRLNDMRHYDLIEDRYLLENFIRSTPKDMGADLGRTPRSVTNRMYVLGLNINRALGKPPRSQPVVLHKYPLSSKAEAFEMHKAGYRLFEIIKKIGVSRVCLLKWIGDIEGYKGTNGETLIRRSQV